MIYYELIINYIPEESVDEPAFDDEKTVTDKLDRQFKSFNEKNYIKNPEDHSELIYSYDEYRIFAALTAGIEDGSGKDRAEKIVSEIRNMDGIISAEIKEFREITASSMKEILDEANESDIVPYGRNRRFRRRAWDYLESCVFGVNEEIVDPDPVTYKQAKTFLEGLMADKSLRDEIDRIYDDNNSNEFYGFPVHYRITAANSEAARDIARLMVRTLHSKNRIPGTRLTVISDITVTRHDRDFDLLIKNTGGTAVIIELQGDPDEGPFASDKTLIARVVTDFIEKYSKDTLFFLYENKEIEGFAGDAISRIENEIDIVSLEEGRGDEKEARAYMKRVILESRYAGLMDDKAFDYLKKRKSFHASDVRNAVDEWSRMCLKEKAYSAYSKCGRKRQKRKNKEKKNAYDELQKMIGLEKVKNLVDDILAYYKINKARKRYLKDDNTGMSRHMIFTGNPGCAKTTVARLLADILLEEGILSTGKYVECGRADLVGRYVGWTAKAVRAKFMQARGGVLFIDEAYSLVDGSRSFGDEAINTIVQEMENHRDDVIVIFAGYPEPMKEFIEKNEGLRSRIAFHIEFPDYNEDELFKILSLMVKERGYKIAAGCEDKCLDIFRKAVKSENFGNGRFARNLLEHAVMNQAGRIAKKCRKEKENYSIDMLLNLMPEDFDGEGILNAVHGEKMKLGFSAGG